jgi:hypothetical protein
MVLAHRNSRSKGTDAVPDAPDAPGIGRLHPAGAAEARAAQLWVLLRIRRAGRVLGANDAGDVIIAVGDVVGVVEYHGSERGLRPLVPCVRCGRRTPSPVLLFRRRRDLRRPLDPILCASCSRGRQQSL